MDLLNQEDFIETIDAENVLEDGIEINIDLDKLNQLNSDKKKINNLNNSKFNNIDYNNPDYKKNN